MLVQRLGAVLLDGYDPAKAMDPKASSQRREEISARYRARMKAEAERDGAKEGVKRLFRQFFLQAGGNEAELSPLPVDVEAGAPSEQEKGMSKQKGKEKESDVREAPEERSSTARRQSRLRTNQRGARRFRLGRLAMPERLLAFRRSFAARAPALEALAAHAEAQAAAGATAIEREALIDALDAALAQAVEEAAEQALGVYYVHKTPAQTRPISLLPLFRRLFEILLLPHLTSSSWSVLYPHQSGFRSGYSCSSSILAVDHHARSSRPFSAFLDFRSAYDRPPLHLIDQALRYRRVPSLIRSLIWSLLTNSASFSLVVNGLSLPPLPRRCGVPQCAPSSPRPFNFFLDPLLFLLNFLPGVEASAYADEVALQATDLSALQSALDAASSWADEWGMAFNVQKSAVLAPVGYEAAASSLSLANQPLPVVQSFKYLGVERTASSIDFQALLYRKVRLLQNSLRSLKAAAVSFSPRIRLSLLKTFFLVHLDYGGAILSLALDIYLSLSASPSFAALEAYHVDAARWVSDIGYERRTAVAASVAGLPPPFLRLQHLSLGLALHLDQADPLNPATLFLSHFRSTADPSVLYPSPPLNTPLLFHLDFLSSHARFLARRAELVAQNNPPSPASPTSANPPALSRAALLPPSTNVLATSRPTGTFDGALSIPSLADRRCALRWRAGNFAIHLPCIRCGKRFTRTCALHLWAAVGAVDEDGPVSEERPREFSSAVEGEQQKRDELAAAAGQGRGAKRLAAGRLDVMDLLIGHRRKELREVAVKTLAEWERRMQRAFVLARAA
ncbi:hypothetical protein JCM8547_002971 [Rhodosporidiobolus lusitaniae]